MDICNAVATTNNHTSNDKDDRIDVSRIYIIALDRSRDVVMELFRVSV